MIFWSVDIYFIIKSTTTCPLSLPVTRDSLGSLFTLIRASKGCPTDLSQRSEAVFPSEHNLGPCDDPDSFPSTRSPFRFRRPEGSRPVVTSLSTRLYLRVSRSLLGEIINHLTPSYLHMHLRWVPTPLWVCFLISLVMTLECVPTLITDEGGPSDFFLS